MTSVTELKFKLDWDTVDESVRTQELRATWGRVEIWVGDSCATLAEDLSTGSTRRSITVSLYPLAEWIAFNWWLIKFDSRVSEPSVRALRRNIKSSGDGFIWPDIEIAPVGPVSSIRWSPIQPLAGDTVRYLTSGERWVDSAQLEHSLTRLVQAVITRLEESKIFDTSLQKEWSALGLLDDEETEFCEASARLGLDPFSEGQDTFGSIEDAFSNLSEGVRNDFLDVVKPDSILPALAAVRKSLDRAGSSPVARTDQFSPELVSQAMQDAGSVQPGVPPWVVGYAAARNVRSHLGLRPTDPLENMPVNVSVETADAPEFSGVGKCVDKDALIYLVLLRDMREPSRRFAMSRALWHGAETKGRDGYLLTNARTSRQQIGRAFAAELLAPGAGIRELLPGDARAAAPEELAVVAEHFRTSGMVIGHQVENQLLNT